MCCAQLLPALGFISPGKQFPDFLQIGELTEIRSALSAWPAAAIPVAGLQGIRKFLNRFSVSEYDIRENT